MDFILSDSDLKKCQVFCDEMVAFQKTQRTGGDLTRSEVAKKYDIRRGKIAEFVVRDFFKTMGKECDIDLKVYGWGVWDDGDITIDDKTFSIKSAKHFSSWLLLEKDNRKWEKPPDYFVFVLINREETGGTICGFTTPSEVFQDSRLQLKGNKLKGTNTVLDVTNYCIHKSDLNNNWNMFQLCGLDGLI